MIYQTTGGHASYKDGEVTIRFGYLVGPSVHHIEVDVTAYAGALVRDLMIAHVEAEADREAKREEFIDLLRDLVVAKRDQVGDLLGIIDLIAKEIGE